jgi:prepilin-type N-terminal cleavage/methylation domain-containing protein
MKKPQRGFTLVELLVAVSLGLLVMGAGVVVYQQAQASATYVSQRTAVQANARAAINQLGQNLNLAGYGLPIGGVVVPSAAVFTCTNSSGSSTYAYNCPASALAFPVTSGNATLTGVMGGYLPGVIINGNQTDVLMIAYVDSSPNFYQDNPSVTLGFDSHPLLQATVSGGTTTLYFDTANTYPAINDAQWGFKPGDLVMVSNSSGEAIGEVTSVTASYLQLASGDAMSLNQPHGTSGSVPNVLGFASGTETYNATTNPLLATTVNRVYIVSYYAQTDPLLEASGTSANPTRLYRMVNGDSSKNPPVPVAEQISNLTFTYNLFNSVCGGGLLANQEILTTSQIGLIKTVNASVTGASTLKTTAVPGQAIQQVPLSTSVSPRNLSFYDSYSSTTLVGSCS